jgi:hypothetical protein
VRTALDFPTDHDNGRVAAHLSCAKAWLSAWRIIFCGISFALVLRLDTANGEYYKTNVPS